MSSSANRRDEILAKKAKLAELKRQREQRQKELQTSRQSLDAASTAAYTPNSRTANRADLDSLISSLVDRPSSSTGTPRGREGSPATGTGSRTRSSRPTSIVSGAHDEDGPAGHGAREERPVQSLGLAQMRTVYDSPAEVRKEVITYSKGVQTDDLPESPSETDRELADDRARRKVNEEQDKQREEEIRKRLRVEVEEELKAARNNEVVTEERYPARQLTSEELNAVTGSDDFLDFVERSSKVIERALGEDYDLLADYTTGIGAGEEDDEGGTTKGRRGRRIKEVVQFQDEKWTKRRMLSDLDFSSKYPELLLASYTKAANSVQAAPGLALIWNSHMPDRPEYSFTATSDLLCARFSPYHPNVILGGTYSGQVCMWDTRQRSQDGAPVQRTPLAGERGGHAHPIYSISVVGTKNASNIISVSTDGTTCAWSFDMLSKPQERLELVSPPGRSRTEDIAPTCISFPRSDPTYFLAGTEDGSVVPVHRYDRAGAKAGIDQRIVYRGHTAPVTGLHFHPSRGKIDLGDLALTSGLDWSVKLWRVRPHSSALSTANTATSGLQVERPLLDIMREDVVYDVKWSPTKPGVFGCVDGAGRLEVFDINVDVEIPVARAEPSHAAGDVFGVKSLNKLAWEHNEGRKVAVGGLDGIVTVFEVGTELGGIDTLGKTEDWMSVKKLAAKLDRVRQADGK
ncbi:WD40-repeat-containing domain protein [Elsinoe ampelina]|uniref:WD40-repeat-containing domain protein n=1 Tax=Elsinoe ampelina TaxID=302913 RepID=A0A6A6GJ17_9PEZI|nr:WD40-repeat-containing domain protein [Elsinoe ampelina]